MKIILSIILFLCVTGFFCTAAQSPQQITWENLVPEIEKFEDPFLTLSLEQKVALRRVADTRQMQARGDTISPDQTDIYNASMEKLKLDRIDIDGLLAMRAEITAKRKNASGSVNRSLNGRQVRLPGYVLPLEADDERVTEFLLVPYVGACIHEPLPPANQIVLVRFEKGIEIKERFTPVLVNGKMITQSVTSNLYLMDGSADIPSGYTLEANGVEIYEKK